MQERLTLIKRDKQYSRLLEALERETGGNPVLDFLLQKQGLPTAKEYAEFNWGDPEFDPYEDEDELRTLNLLREIDDAIGA